MDAPKKPKQIIPLLREAVNNLTAHPALLFPFATIAFIQLLVLEIIYFSPRFPLVKFFGPMIQRLEGEAYLHYPQHLVIVPKWFQAVQYFIYLFISSFLVAVAVEMIAAFNSSKKTGFAAAAGNTRSCYVHVVLAAFAAFFIFYGLTQCYGLLIARALQIQSQSGIFFMIKMTVLRGAPYFNLLIGAMVTALFALIYPIIVIDRKKFFPALVLNFKYFFKSFWVIFCVVLIPTLFYVPFLLLRNNLPASMLLLAETRLVLIVVGVVMMVFIDAVVYSAVTAHYLLKYKEQ